MAELFADIPEALENTVEIAKRCNLELTLGKNYLPDFPVPAGMTMDDFFRAQAREGLELRLPKLFNGQCRRPILPSAANPMTNDCKSSSTLLSRWDSPATF